MMTHDQNPFLSRDVSPKDAPDRRQVLNGFGALMASTALPLAAATAVYVTRPGGWILRESDRDVS